MSRDTLASGSSARYVTLPAAGTSGSPTRDGAPLDAGTAMIVSNNWSHLRNESLRLLASDHWGRIVAAGYNNWAALNAEVPDTADRDETVQEIDWSRNNAAVYGPFPLVRDAVGIAPGSDQAPRRIKVVARVRTTGTLSLYVAVTASGATPDTGTLAFQRQSTSSTTLEELTWTFDVPGGAVTARLCGPATDAGPGVVDVEEVYVWVGYLLPSGSGTLAALTIYEVNP